MIKLQYFSLTLIFLFPVMSMKLSLGVDYGTSGLRISVIDTAAKSEVVFANSIRWNSHEILSPSIWISDFTKLCETIPDAYKSNIAYICASGTSSTALLYDIQDSCVCAGPLLYNYNILDDSSRATHGQKPLELINRKAPKNSPAVATTSTLMKLLSWREEMQLTSRFRLVHQADYLMNYLLNRLSSNVFFSDWHNALKLGFDVVALQYPEWLLEILKEADIKVDILPKVVQPGRSIGTIDSELAKVMQFSPQCQVIAGTTDSIAAFLASGVERVGEAVTSLGSTLVIKALSNKQIEDSSLGIYSHRLGDEWLIGGASNVGCQIFRQEGFTDEELVSLSSQMTRHDIPFAEYYPLVKPGERFPVNDPSKLPILDPKPDSRRDYLFALFHSIARIEAEAYHKLESFGASKIERVYTAGGGSRNEFWNELRGRILERDVRKAQNIEASYGAALLGCKYNE